MVRERFGVDEDVCTGDHACIRLSGCPSLSVKRTDDPLKDDPVAAIDNTCVGCGNCGEVAEAAVLCPSFYRADIIYNPTSFDRLHGAAARRGDRLSATPPRPAAHRLCLRQRPMTVAPSARTELDTTKPLVDRGDGDGRPGRRRAGRLDRRALRKPALGGAIDLGARRRPAHRCHRLLHRSAAAAAGRAGGPAPSAVADGGARRGRCRHRRRTDGSRSRHPARAWSRPTAPR